MKKSDFPRRSPTSAAGSPRTGRVRQVLARAGARVLEALESRVMLSTTPAEAALDPTFNQPAGALGINLNNPGPLDSSALWTDASKDFSNWQYAGSTTALSGGDVTQYGFPSGSSGSNNATAYSYMLGYPTGNYQLQYQGTGTISISGIGSVVPGSLTYNAAIDTTTATVAVTSQSGVPLVMTASGLSSGDPLHNLQFMMPGFSPGTTQIVNPSAVARLGAFGTIRLMDAFNTNSDLDSNWSQLTGPNSFSFAGASGMAYVDAIALANETHSNLWWNIPVNASDAFATSLADLFKYGADANGNPYTSTQASPVYAPLAAGLKVHIEYGNELENFTQPIAGVNQYYANQNVSNGILDGSLQVDGEEDLYRLHQYYDDFQAVYSPGGGSFSSNVGFIFAGAFSSSGADPFTAGAFQFAQENNGKSGQTNPANWGPIFAWLEAVATSDYQGLTSSQNPTTLDQLFADLNANLQANSSTAASQFVSQSSINVPLYGYEGGQALVGSNSTTDALYAQAESDPRMGAFYQALIDQWYANGGSLFNLYSYAAPYINGNFWGLLPSADQTGSTKWDAVIKRLVPMGDANLDGSVNFSDFQILEANWGSTTATWQTGDFNGDGVVNLADLQLLEQNINTSSFTSAQVAAYVSFVNAVTASNIPSTPGTPTVSVAPTTSTVSITWVTSYDNAGIASYVILRNGVQAGTSTTNSFSDTGLAAGDSYSYSVEAVDKAGLTSVASGALTVNTPLPLVKLTGSLLGTSGSYNNDGNTAAMAVDGNLSTFFDAPGPNGDWVGLDLGSTQTISAISYAPRQQSGGFAYETRMVGGVFQYAANSSFTNPTTFYTIFSTPADGYTTINFTSPITARYVRYLAPANSYGNVAEIDFYANGAAGDTQPPTSPGTPTISTPATRTAVSITWAASTDNVGVQNYVIFRNGVQAGTSTTNTYTDSTLIASTTYSYTVEAVDAAGNVSNPSGALSVTSAGAQGPTITSVTSSTANGTYTSGTSTSVTVNFNEPILVTGNPLLTLNTGAVIPSQAPLITPPTGGTYNIGFIGDSITAGVGDTGTSGADAMIADLSAEGINATEVNEGYSGSNTGQWTPGATGSLLPAAITAFQAANVNTVCIMLGTNDAKQEFVTPSTQAQYVANMTQIVAALHAAGIANVIINEPIYPTPGALGNQFTSASVALIDQYIAALDPIPGAIIGDRTAYQKFESNPQLLNDGIHPNQAGYTWLGSAWAAALVAAIPTTTSASPTSSLTFTYNIAPGQNTSDLDVASISALSLNGGTITDTTGDPANLTLPAPGGPGSLGAGSSIAIDTTPPSLTLTAPANGNGSLAFSGTASVGTIDSSTVTIYLYSSGSPGGTAVQTFTATADPVTGAYSVAPVTPTLPFGVYTAVAAQWDTLGNLGFSSPGTFVYGSGGSQLTGTPSGNTTSTYNNDGEGFANVFDGNTSTFFDAASPNGDWVQLDLGSAYAISAIAYAPRFSYESRMNGGNFEASNDPTFTTGVATLYTLTGTPTDSYTDQNITDSGAFRYVRYVAPAGSYGNIAEMQVFGAPSTAASIPAAPGTPTLSSSTSTTATIAWAPSTSTGVTAYDVFRNGSQIGATNGTTFTYSDTGLSPSTAYSYTVAAVAGTLTSAPSGALPITTPAITVLPPSTPTLSSSTSTTATIAWTASTTSGVTGYLVFRNGSQIGTTSSTTFTYSDTGLSASTTYSYTVEAVASGIDSIPSGAASVTTPAAQLTGIVIGTSGSYGNAANATASAAFDGNLSTFFDAPGANGDWVGLDLGSPYTITSIEFAPRAASGGYPYEQRMVGGVFQVSNNASFSTTGGGVVDTLYTIATTPADGYTTITIPAASSPGAFEFVRYLAPNNSYGNIAEMEVFGTPTSTTAPSAPGTPTLTSSTSSTATIGWTASTSSGVTGYDVLRNGSQIGTTNSTTFTYSDSGLSPSTTYSYTVEAVSGGLTSVPSGALPVTTPVATAPLAPGTPTLSSSTSTTATIAWTASTSTGVTGYDVLRNGSQIGTTNSTTFTYSDSGLSPSTTYSYTVEAVAGGLTSVPSGALSVTTPSSTTPTQLTGTVIGTAGSYGNVANATASAAFDGNLSTFFDAPTANGDWVGLDLGSPYTITSIEFAPRAASGGYPYENRMVGGVFQVSNNANFSTTGGGVVDTLYTIATTPADGYTTITIPAASSPGAFEFVRYLAPNNSYGNIAEMEVFGTPTSTTAPSTPGTPTLSSSTSTTATIAWTASTSSGVTGYDVLRSGSQIGTTNSTTFTYSDSGLSPSTTYSYTVEAVSGGLTSTPSGALSVTTPAATVPLAPATPTLSSSTSTTATITWTASTSTGVTGYIVLRNGTQIGTTNSTTFTYSDFPLSPATTYSYTVEAVASGLTSVPSGALSVTTPASSGPTQLTGTVIGTSGSYDGLGSDAAGAVFDGNLSTFFDAPTANGAWVGLDLGSTYTITSIKFAPRSISGGFPYENRMVGGVFQASNDPTFTTGVVNLYTVTSTPADGYTTQTISVAGSYRYVRYLSPNNSYGNIAEMAVFGTPSTAAAPTAPGTPTLTNSTSSTAAIGWTASTSTGVTGYIVLRNGAQVGTTNSSTFTYSDTGLSALTTYSYTVEAVASGLSSVPSGALSVTTPVAPASTQLTGTVIGTSGSYGNAANATASAAFDGNLSTFFDAPTANGDWAGLDLGSARTITSITYAPRATSGGFPYENRMVGGIFQASNDPTFTTGVVNLYTITSTPADGYTTVPGSAAGTYRYVRYLAPSGSYGNVAELQFFGY